MVLAPVVTDEIARRSLPSLALPVTGKPSAGEQFLRQLVPVLQREMPDWDAFDRVELLYRAREGHVLLASYPLGVDVPRSRWRDVGRIPLPTP